MHDAILDDGSTNNVFPLSCQHYLTNFTPKIGRLSFGNQEQLKTIGVGCFGVLSDILVCEGVALPLISVRYLTNVLNYKVFDSDNKAYVLKETLQTNENNSVKIFNINETKYKVVASATLHKNLYQIDDMDAFLNPSLFDANDYPSAYTTSSAALPGADVGDSTSSDEIVNNNEIVFQPKYSKKQIKLGSARVMIRSSHIDLNLLEWLHVRFGHMNPELIKYMVKHDLLLGCGVTFKEIQHLVMGMCDSCMHSRMHAFPIYRSLRQIIYKIFQCLTSDYVPFNFKTKRGYTGCFMYQDLASDKPMVTFTKSKTEWLKSLKQVIREFGPERNPLSTPLRILKTDFDSVVKGTDFANFLEENNIELQSSAPYKHQQNKIERTIQSIWNMVRCNMRYNKSPKGFIDHCVQYAVTTYGYLCSVGETKTRDEVFWGQKTDVSTCVPFYAQGWYHVSNEESKVIRRLKRSGKEMKDKAVNCYMLGYANPYRVEDKSNATVFFKNSYTIWIPSTLKTAVRHDCYFKCYPSDTVSLLNSDPKLRQAISSESVVEELPDDEGYEDTPQLHELEKVAQEQEQESEDEELEDASPDPAPTSTLDYEYQPTYWSALTRRADVEINSAMNTTSSIVIDKPPTASAAASKSRAPTLSERLRRIYEKQIMNTKQATTKPPFHPDIVAALSRVKSLEVPGVDLLPKKTSIESCPQTMLEALSKSDAPYWAQAFVQETDRLDYRELYHMVPQFDGPESKDPDQPIKSKFAFRQAEKANGDIKFRSRMVGCGYSQIFGKDYDNSFSPTAKYKSLCILLHIAAVQDWYISGIDVENAFIEPKIDKDIYMYLPKDIYRYPNGNKVKVKLDKSLYGLKQAGDLWNKLIDGQFRDMKYYRTAHDTCVYVYYDSTTGDRVIAIVYVDDILFFGKDKVIIDKHIQYLIDHITKLTESDIVDRYIGVDIKRDLEQHTITLSQKPYMQQYVQANVPGEMQSKDIPLPPTVDYETKGNEPPIQDKVGQLRFLADRTKMEIAAGVGILGSAAASPSPEHVKGTINIGQYLKGALDDTVVFGGNDKEIYLFGYSDASYNPRTKSRLGYCLFLNLESGAILSRSYTDNSVSHSSCESEVNSIDGIVRAIIWLRGFLKEIGFEQKRPTTIYTDSQSAEQLIKLFQVGNNSAHIVMRLNYLHQESNKGTIELKYINTDDEVADILTKLLAIPKFIKFKEFLLHGHKGIEPASFVKKIPEPSRASVLKKILKYRLKNKK